MAGQRLLLTAASGGRSSSTATPANIVSRQAGRSYGSCPNSRGDELKLRGA